MVISSTGKCQHHMMVWDTEEKKHLCSFYAYYKTWYCHTWLIYQFWLNDWQMGWLQKHIKYHQLGMEQILHSQQCPIQLGLFSNAPQKFLSLVGHFRKPILSDITVHIENWFNEYISYLIVFIPGFILLSIKINLSFSNRGYICFWPNQRKWPLTYWVAGLHILLSMF